MIRGGVEAGGGWDSKDETNLVPGHYTTISLELVMGVSIFRSGID